MSGGSFNYLCHRSPHEAMGTEDYAYMADELAALSHPAAKQIAAQMHAARAAAEEGWERIVPVLRAVEWWRSNDWGIDQVMEALDEYAAGTQDDLSEFRDPRDPHAGRLVKAPEPCPHGNGSNCDCQLPWYAGLYVVPITFKADEKERHVVVRARMTHDGGMREFMDPASGEVIGSCGLYHWYDAAVTLEQFQASASESAGL